MVDLKSLEAKWELLWLTEEEQLPIILDDETTIKDHLKEQRSLLGKINADITIGT